MAISPDTLLKNFEGEVSNFENIIDAELKTKKIYRGDAVDINYPTGMSSKHLKVLREKYMSMGWEDVTIRQCGPNESCLSFKTKS